MILPKKTPILLLLSVLLCMYSCGSVKLPEQSKIYPPQEHVSSVIAARGVKTPEQLFRFFMAEQPRADSAKVMRLAEYYVEEGKFEGINSDLAFVQMCLETGFLRFGGLVTESMNNFCGLGAIDKEHPGVQLPDEITGVKAHIQHLHAYGTTAALKGTLVDPRYMYVKPRGKASDAVELGGTWASDSAYGDKLLALLCRLESY